jgi:exopolyphosphatase/guanosine-5'-triphosphate,3'-diphosphate pyrophosphatase
MAVGASGSIKAIQLVCEASGWSDQTITSHALQKLGKLLVKSKHIDAANLPKLSDERRPIFPGAVAILTAIFDSLDVDEMAISDKALREGLLLDLMGRDENRDIHESSIAAMQHHYGVDSEHAERVAATARGLLDDIGDDVAGARESARLLHWAALLHEIGLAIAHEGYHKHGSYIVRNADIQGLSQSEQAVLAALLYLQRGKFRRAVVEDLPAARQASVESLTLLLRLAVLLHRGRDPQMQAPVHITIDEKNLKLTFDNNWLADHPLTHADLMREQRYLDAAGYVLEISA